MGKLRREFQFSPLTAALLFAALAAVWIALSATLLQSTIYDPAVAVQLELASAAGFVVLTSALLYLFLRRRISSQAKPSEENHITQQNLLPLLIAVISAVPAIMLVVANLEAPWLREDALKELRAIATLKSHQIENWLDERYADAETLTNDPGFNRLVLQAAEGSESAREVLRQRLKAFRRAYHYRSISILPKGGEQLFQANSGEEDQVLWQQLPLESMAADPGEQRSALRYYVDARDGVHLVVSLPLKPPEGETAPMGLLLLHIAPEHFLYPYITAWPTPSASGETLLATRDGESVLFLTPLRHLQGEPGTVTHRLSDPELPAAVALLSGTSGTFIGNDYRGERVLAAYQPIPGTGWQLIAKRDRTEVMEPLYILLGWVGVITLTAVVVLALLLLHLWRQQQHIHQLEIRTERRRADTLVRQFFELPFVGIAITDPGSKGWVRFNDRLCELLGYSREELANMSWAEVTHPDDLDADVAEFDKVMRGESDGYSMDKRYIRKDGSVVDAYIDVKCIRKTDGSVDYFVAMVQDIGERKAAEQRLRNSETRFRAVFDTVNDGILLADVEAGHFAMSNTTIEQMLGYSGEELKQMGVEDIHPAESLDDARNLFMRQLRAERSIIEALPVLRRDGSVFTAEISAAAVTIDGRQYLVGVFRDITARLQAEKQVRDSLKLLDFAIEQIPIPVIIASAPDVTITHINQAAKALLAKPIDDPRAIPLAEQREYWPTFYPHGSPYQVKDYPLTIAVQEGKTTRGEEMIIRHPDGDHWVMVSSAPLLNEDGTIIAGIVAFPDITAQKQAQREIEKSRKEAQQYLDIAGVMLISLDTEGRIVLANRKACEVLGYEEQELLGREWFEHHLPATINNEVRAIFTRLVTGEIASVEYFENPVLNRNGEERLIAWHNSVIRDHSGAITGILSSGEDITAQRQTEAALAANQARLRTLIDTIPDLIWLKDTEGYYLACNPMFERFFGAEEEEIVGKTDYDFVDRDLADSFREHDIKAMAAGKPSSNEETLTFSDGGYRGTFETIKTPMLNSEGDLIGVLGIARDISERKKAMVRIERLSQLYATLSQTNQAIVRSQNEQELFDAVCRNAVEYGGFRMATVTIIDPEKRAVYPVARYGEGTQYLDKLTLSDDPDSPFGRGPTGTALREGAPQWCQDFLHDATTQPWHERAEEFGHRASAALPIRRGGQVIGAYNLYAGMVDAFDEAVRNLLMEMTVDISFALDHLDQERQRQQAEERLKLVIKGSNDAPWDWDLEQDRFWYSPQWWDLHGYEVDELPTDSQLWRKMIHPDDLPHVDEALASIMQPGNEWEEVEARARHKDGHYTPVLVRGFASRNEDGKVVRISGTISDLTERKAIEEQLRQQRDELLRSKKIIDSHLDNSPVGVIEWNPDFRILRWSDRAETIFGWSEDEVLGKHPSEFPLIFEEDGEAVKAIMQALTSGKAKQNHIINRNYTKNGSVVYSEWYNSALRDDEGNLLSILSLVQDITEQHQAEEELRSRENLLQKIFDILPVGLWFADTDGKLVRGNPAGVAIWGAEPHVDPADYGLFKARRLPSGETIQPDDWALAHTVREGVTITDELLEIDAFDGKKKIILNYTAPVTDEEGRLEAAIVVNLDITDRHRAQQELQERVDELNRWYEATLGREERVLELKQEINKLLERDGQPPRYPSAETHTPSPNPTKEPNG